MPEEMTKTETNGFVEAPDPFGLAALRSAPLEAYVADLVTVSIPVRRPGKVEFVRVHPDPAFVVDGPLIDHEDGLDHELYWVAPNLWGELAGEYRTTRLLVAQSKSKVTFLWPVKLPRLDSSGGRRWSETALEIAEIAKQKWVRLRPNKSLGGYEALVAKGRLDEPEWPDKTLAELMEVAFKGRFIEDLDHQVLRELRGEV